VIAIVKYYKHNKIIKILTIFGSFLGLIYCILQITNTTYTISWEGISGWGRLLWCFIGMNVTVLTLLVAFKPDDPLPWHWLLLLIFAALTSVFSFIWGGILILGGGVIALIDDI